MSIARGWTFIDEETRVLLGLPEMTTSFTLHTNVDDVVRIDCEYIVTDDQCDALKKRLKKFVLHEVEDTEIEGQDDSK